MGRRASPILPSRALWQTALVVIALDQASKVLVVHLLGLHRSGVIELWPPYLTFRMAWNEGVNFGLLSSNSDLTRWLLIGVALAISAWVLIWVRREPDNRRAQIAAGLLIGGALGNVIDRLIYGAVADFLNMSCCGIDNPYAFNVADIAIFAGAAGLILWTDRAKTP
ncbi:signal peptidase II [Frigidibacter sp. ROC022]|uniref:signal peptidase II n=1 Tax=Frigidibacter sp. ROC022 TaxID=2971796 RepID=UPI00215A90F6|nr:signal peptidase II [Frigidibacter sp. ROC022]MCR8724884.1 signal peptidase II [Frigidibacter sp. ROC022]